MAPYVRVKMGPDLQACRDALKPELALYIGGMGARTKNFYNDFTKQLGYEEAAVKIQDAFLSGRRAEAIAAVPDALVDEVSLVGSPERIKDRLQAWKAAGKTHAVGSMLLSGATVESLRVVAKRSCKPPSYGDGGVVSIRVAAAHDPSARCAGTSPRCAQGGTS